MCCREGRVNECLVGLSTNVNNATSQLGLQGLSDQQRQLGLNCQQSIQKSSTQQGLISIHELAGHQSTGQPGQTNLKDLTNQTWRPGNRGFYLKVLKGTVSVFLSDPLCKDDNARFTTVPLKSLSDQV